MSAKFKNGITTFTVASSIPGDSNSWNTKKKTTTCKQTTVNTKKTMILKVQTHTYTQCTQYTHRKHTQKVRFTLHGCAQNTQTQKKHTGNKDMRINILLVLTNSVIQIQQS